jgi:predicted aspartyl protease
MGEVRVEIELENYRDRVLAEHGHLDPARIRRERVRVLADSGATVLLLPQDLVERLGLQVLDEKAVVTYADERKEELAIAAGLTVRVGDRSMVTDCLVGAPLSRPLLGQIVLERLDLLVDCAQGKLTPRPESPYLPLLSLK